VNTDELEHALYVAERRVLEIQTKLHRWAGDDPRRRFDDLFNLVADPGFLLVAWDRVRGNKGARTAGVDGQTAYYVEAEIGVEVFLDRLRTEIKDRSFRPLPTRERMIPKPGTTKRRRLGISTVRDRVVQASLKLVLEPVFEADFLPCSYGFRPNRRAHDAVAEVRHFTSRTYEWVVEGDIQSCLDPSSHCSFADFRVQKSPSCGVGTSIRRPFLRPVRVRTARRSPRLTFCNTVWRETPSARLAWCRASHPSGALSVSMPRS
jgi:RNA-directed DNA polymerase